MKERDPIRHFSDNVRDYSHRIIETHKDLVQIDDSALEGDFINQLRKFQEDSKGSDPFAVEKLTTENELGLNLFFDVINFCYSNPYSHQDYSYTDNEDKIIKRSSGLKKAMTETEINWGKTSDVAKITTDFWAKAIQLDKNKDFYLGEDRGKRISEFANKLNKSGFKNVIDFLEFTEFDVEILLPILDKSGYFDDKFQKRSQLTINMMNGVIKRRLGKEFNGIDNLTIMADYRLPQVMYNSGVIKLSENLLDRLTKQEVLESGSPEELSLRAASVVVGEKVSKILKINEGAVDGLLWTLSQKMSKEDSLKIPHMLVATDQY